MRHLTIAGVAAAVIAAGLLVSSNTARGQQVFATRCLHDQDETQANRMRREQAIALARAINAAQGQSAGLTRRYQPLPQLPALPATPEGFAVRLYTDGTAYMFSIKDDRDPCRYGIFSDQQAFLYESSPAPPLVAS